MSKAEFVYTTYIRSTPEKIWQGLTNSEFTLQYWGQDMKSDWKKGSKWESTNNRNDKKMLGEVLESNPPKRLVFTWANSKDMNDVSRVTYEIEQTDDQDFVKLNVVHDKLQPGSEMATSISKGWPLVIANLKTFLETGKTMNLWACSDTKPTPQKVAS
jgi:uncharacterized protein YndB with AHSA1/START domain